MKPAVLEIMRGGAWVLVGFISLSGACGGRAADDSDAGGSGGSTSETGGQAGSGGADGSGGGIATGGSSTGGTAGSGGSGGEACETGSVSFRVTTEEPRSHCPDACAIRWLTITDAHGDEIALRSMCQTSCADCRPIACAAGVCPDPEPLEEPLEFLWEGLDLAQSRCGEQGYSCYEPRCVPRGVYQARICLTRTVDDACSDTGEVDCVELDVHWPSSEVFEVTLPAHSSR